MFTDEQFEQFMRAVWIGVAALWGVVGLLIAVAQQL